MKRIVSSLLSLLALSSLFTFTSCQKETVGNGTQFRATMEGCTSKDGKTALNGTALNWVAGDEIAVYGTAGRGIYTATPQTPATVALFDNVSGETGNAPFRAYYPTTLTTDGVHVTLPAVQTTADGSLTEFPMYAQSDDNTLAFRNLCGALKLHLTKAGVSVSSIEVSTNTPINGQYTLRYTGVPVIDYESNGTNSTVLECENPQPIANGKDFYIYLPHGNYTEMAFTITASDGSVCTKHSKANVAIYITRSQYTTINLGENDLVFADPDWVDLGLPSGLLWATRNVGATSPEDYGDYFAWGETQPKEVYDWSTYIYSNGADDQLTKYCSNSDYGYNGFTDNLTILQPGDDAATANYGGRTPTKVEWQELLDNTTATWTTQNGVNGRLFTGTNGNSIFLPAAGCRWDSNIHGGGYYGYYWSSSLYPGLPFYAWEIGFGSGSLYLDAINRMCGQPVRAVRSAE
ncbi:MAG: hypothetical protein IK126_00700 [Bacteroidales bacterium]|nr:hypothetical protein [Bacteroidales bacterium]